MEKSDILAHARKHSVVKDLPAPDFFEGAILGNGNLGVVVCTRPDAVVCHFGHNDIWDIRIDESHMGRTGTFAQIFGRILREKETFRESAWYREYEEMLGASYDKNAYPRPYPASSLYLFFDPGEYRLLGHRLDLSDGVLTIFFEGAEKKKYSAVIFVSQSTDTLYCRTENERGEESAIFHRLRILPHSKEEGIPPCEVRENGFMQVLPYNDFSGVPRPFVDKYFSVSYVCDGEMTPDDRPRSARDSSDKYFASASLQDGVREGLSKTLCGTKNLSLTLSHGYVGEEQPVGVQKREEALHASREAWREYWECSGVALADEELEHLWYTNTYFLRCAMNEHSTCPGIFANWSYGDIGTAWHGDYHMNYNTQQPFWGLMGANRANLHKPYIALVERLLPLAKAWARDFYELDGAAFPHSAYPVPMRVNPYPTTNWGWEVFETPWTVQSLWWHYTYTQDVSLLKERLYPLMREAALFMVAYITREGAAPLADGTYHIFPTIVPELYGLCPGLSHNRDGACDLAFTKFLFEAVLEATRVLQTEDEEAELVGKIKDILSHYPHYPTEASRYGTVYVSVKGENPDRVIYNAPSNMMQIFPCEDTASYHGGMREIAERSYAHHYNEGGNDVVFYHLIGARLGVLDLEQFKREVRYATLPNGTVTDRVRMSGGRYEDDISFDYMSRMGIWFENFSLYAVVNECLISGYGDVVELFPLWDKEKEASFTSMCTKGAFLVDASCALGSVTEAKIFSECGGIFRMKNPWSVATDNLGREYDAREIVIRMQKGERIVFSQKQEG